MSKTYTAGNIIIEDIKVGDIHYEFDYGCGIKCEVITLPERDDNGKWTWKSKHSETGAEIAYMVTEGYAHYGPKLYDHVAYNGIKWI